MTEKQPTTIWASSGVTKEAKAFVHLHWVDQSGSLSPAEARAFALTIIEASDAADFDAVLMGVIIQADGDVEDAFTIIEDMRRARTGDVTHSGQGSADLGETPE